MLIPVFRIYEKRVVFVFCLNLLRGEHYFQRRQRKLNFMG